jgi:hypothetical protein
MLQRLRRTRKVTIKASKHDPLLQEVFMSPIGQLVPDPAVLMFADESSKDECTVNQRHSCWFRSLSCFFFFFLLSFWTKCWD